MLNKINEHTFMLLKSLILNRKQALGIPWLLIMFSYIRLKNNDNHSCKRYILTRASYISYHKDIFNISKRMCDNHVMC